MGRDDHFKAIIIDNVIGHASIELNAIGRMIGRAIEAVDVGDGSLPPNRIPEVVPRQSDPIPDIGW
jgi:hypothetical protein